LHESAGNVYPHNTLSKRTNEDDSSRPDFWSERYATGKTPWQLDHIPVRLTEFIGSLKPQSNVLVPGCGQDFQTIAALRRSGHNVMAIDFCPVAIEAAQAALPDMGGDIVLGDFFTYDFEAARFDLIYERTFLCSLPPLHWKNYAARVAQLLRPNGVLAGFFFYGDDSDPPPYPLTKRKADEIFGTHFKLQTNQEVDDSLPIFAGQEKWQEWRLRLR